MRTSAKCTTCVSLRVYLEAETYTWGDQLRSTLQPPHFRLRNIIKLFRIGRLAIFLKSRYTRSAPEGVNARSLDDLRGKNDILRKILFHYTLGCKYARTECVAAANLELAEPRG